MGRLVRSLCSLEPDALLGFDFSPALTPVLPPHLRVRLLTCQGPLCPAVTFCWHLLTEDDRTSSRGKAEE